MESRGQKLPRPNEARSAANSSDLLPSGAVNNSRQNGSAKSQEGPTANGTEGLAANEDDGARATSERAYRLWENDGRPHGRDQDYWFRAESELKNEQR
jgi:hypothetical protein